MTLDVNAVFETESQALANSYIGDGWALLSVAQDPLGTAHYVLGRPVSTAGTVDPVPSPGEPVDTWPCLVALLRRLRRDAGAPENESFGVPLPDEDLSLAGVLGISWRDWPGNEARKALVLEEDPA